MIDDHLETELELLKTDINALSQKLESKSQAVIILQNELKKCAKERDEFKYMAEQVMSRYQLLRKAVWEGLPDDLQSNKQASQIDRRQLVSLLVQCREANRGLEQELVELRAKLSEALGDICLLRKQLSVRASDISASQESKTKEREKCVLQLECLTARVHELEREMGRCSDDKQELITERDIYRNKCDRLNNELNYILSGDDRKIVDIDTLIMEKHALHSRLQAVTEEKQLAMMTLAKYQRMLERKASKSSSAGSDCPFSPTESPNHCATSPFGYEVTEKGGASVTSDRKKNADYIQTTSSNVS